jgi:hypothetical protein
MGDSSGNIGGERDMVLVAGCTTFRGESVEGPAGVTRVLGGDAIRTGAGAGTGLAFSAGGVISLTPRCISSLERVDGCFSSTVDCGGVSGLEPAAPLRLPRTRSGSTGAEGTAGGIIKVAESVAGTTAVFS